MLHAVIIESEPPLLGSLHDELKDRFPFLGLTRTARASEAIEPPSRRQPCLILVAVHRVSSDALRRALEIKAVHRQALLVAVGERLELQRSAATAPCVDHCLELGEALVERAVALVERFLQSVRKAVVIDDSPTYREVLVEVLLTHWPALMIAEAGDGPEGLVDVMGLRPELVVLDLHSSGADWRALLRALKVVNPDGAVVVISRFDFAEYRDATLGQGADHFFAKDSIRSADFLDSIRAILGPLH
jgi:CheY-like chemotaxis protein